MTYRVIRANFVIAVFLTVVGSVAILISMDPKTYLATHPGAKPPVGLALGTAFEIGMWFYAYRNDEGSKVAAATGCMLFAPVVAALLIPEISEDHVDLAGVVALSYLSLSHLAYAVANWRKSARSLMDL